MSIILLYTVRRPHIYLCIVKRANESFLWADYTSWQKDIVVWELLEAVYIKKKGE